MDARYSLKQRTSAEVEQRRLELQQYLQALCDLPNVRSSQTFHTFLKVLLIFLESPAHDHRAVSLCQMLLSKTVCLGSCRVNHVA